jgi:hypothetical protein
MSAFQIDGQRQPKPPPLKEEDILLLLHPLPVVIYDDPEGWHAYEAWLPTVPDQLPLT